MRCQGSIARLCWAHFAFRISDFAFYINIQHFSFSLIGAGLYPGPKI